MPLNQKNQLESSLQKIYRAALAAVEPASAVKGFVERAGSRLLVGHRLYDLDSYHRVFLVGVGKAGVPMAAATEEILGDYLDSGMVIVRHGSSSGGLIRTRVRYARHPLPDRSGQQAAQELLTFLDQSVTPEDLLIVVISGGGSALLPAPVPPITLADKQETTQVLIRSGATIQQINTIRKHLSQVKGGRLVERTRGCDTVALLLSDVVGDDLASIASGLTVPDPSTFQECLQIIHTFGLEQSLPSSVLGYIRAGAHSEAFSGMPVQETPKPGDTRFRKVQNVVVGSNILALQAARRKAEESGFQTLILTSALTGDVGHTAKFYSAIAREVLTSGNPLGPPCCLISGGEPTVIVRGDGKGGRNQHLALSFLRETGDQFNHRVLFASLGSDGADGPTDAAGAWVTSDLVEAARRAGLSVQDHLDRNDSYHFFDALGHLIKTGDTQTNVMDLHILLVSASGEE